ncbi:MAG: translation initiation factor IF-2, partial [Chroococcales cyanobacterium]
MNNGKVRIYELSKELNLDNKDIINICDQLNIAVKSHSSTITESQAERIRATAEKQMSSQDNSDAGIKLSANAKGGRAQEILEIRKHSPSPSASATSSGQDERLMTPPPRPPAKPQEPAANQETEPEKPLEKAPQRPQPQAQESRPVPPETNEEDFDQPTLLRPPARPKRVKPELTTKEPPKKDKEQPKVAKEKKQPPKKVETSQPAVNKEIKKPALPKKSAPTVAKEKPEEETVKTPPAPKLQQPPRRPKPPKPPTEIEPDLAVDKEDEAAVEPEEEDLSLDLKAKPKPKLKRPTVRPTRDKDWEEEDEEQQTKTAKGKAKSKRRKPLIEDEEEDLAAVSEGAGANAAINVSQSIARPPKPSSSRPSKPAAAIAQPTKKPTPKSAQQRSEPRERRREKKQVQEKPETIVLEGTLTVRDLANLMNVPETDIIRQLFFKGVAVNITQTLDLETAKMVAEEMGVSVETPEERAAAAKVTEMLDVSDLESLQQRPPVVTIMGHVDHGKTTLLDSIRQTKVAAGEAGGITQHIGAYHVDVEHNGEMQQVVFLDTPGHEAFTAMRARGTRVTDIAILVVAADDGVQPQTREAISHAKAAEVPIIVAINKIDKPGSEPDRVKQELTEQGLVPEEWGGETIMVPVSAINGENLDTLLEMILLVAEIEELSANPDRLARGTVIEANLDKTRGPVATLLIQNGTLRVGDTLVAGACFGKIRAMIDDRGNRVDEAHPSFAVEILGLSEVPSAGDEFEVYESEKEARAIA